jgi:ABC-type phosphate/phosphonate transport system ATPase subunit
MVDMVLAIVFRQFGSYAQKSTILQGFVIRGGSERDGQYLAIKEARAEEARKEVESWLRQIGMLK